jgi:hypothetical protein
VLRHEALVNGTPVPDATVVGILDDVFLPLLTGTPRVSAHGPKAAFAHGQTGRGFTRPAGDRVEEQGQQS